jgi:DEP domain-containing protein 5
MAHSEYHVEEVLTLPTSYYYYTLKAEYAMPPSTPRTSWFRTVSRQVSEEHSTGFASPRKSRRQLILSQSMVIDVDRNKRSDQAETVVLHHDIIHNPGTAFHFELHWIGTAARCIEDLIHRQWGWTIERYGLKLVEAYVGQIEDIQDRGRNPFQSCFPIRLAVAPPSVADIPRRASEGATQLRYPFECAILRRFGFVLDIEASALYPAGVDVYYSYRASKFTHSQYVHRSGVAFVQLVGGLEGFLYLTNRLMFHGRPGAARKHEQSPADAADALRRELNAFCSDAVKLEEFYAEEIENLRKHAPPSRKGSEEPPDLSI